MTPRAAIRRSRLRPSSLAAKSAAKSSSSSDAAMASPSYTRQRAETRSARVEARRRGRIGRDMGAMPVVVFADGAAKGNPGPGGWGAIVVTPDGHVTELGGGARHTTNNQMELTAPIEALTHLQRTPGAVAIYTDSTYVIRGIREWIWAWRKRNWKTA